MSGIRFLFDECVSHHVIRALLKMEPAIDLLFVGGPGAPPKMTPDADLLLAAEASGRILVSGDHTTMKAHIAARFAASHHTRGVVLLKPGWPIRAYAVDLLLIWAASEPAEWLDQTDWIPY
jgi:hypothetical protein